MFYKDDDTVSSVVAKIIEDGRISSRRKMKSFVKELNLPAGVSDLNARRRSSVVRHDIKKNMLFDTDEGLMFALELPMGSRIVSAGYMPKDDDSYFSTIYVEEMPTEEEATKTVYLCFVRDGMQQPYKDPNSGEDFSYRWQYEHTTPAKDFSNKVSVYHLYYYEDDIPF